MLTESHVCQLGLLSLDLKEFSLYRIFDDELDGGDGLSLSETMLVDNLDTINTFAVLDNLRFCPPPDSPQLGSCGKCVGVGRRE